MSMRRLLDCKSSALLPNAFPVGGAGFCFLAESYQLGLVLLLSLPLSLPPAGAYPKLSLHCRTVADPVVDPAADPVECVLPVLVWFPDSSLTCPLCREEGLTRRQGCFLVSRQQTTEKGGCPQWTRQERKHTNLFL